MSNDYDDELLKAGYYSTDTAESPFERDVDQIATHITNILKTKNKAYGNSALEPCNTFSQLDAKESICARLDDKLMRIKNKGITDATEDTVDDLIGYLFLLKMSM